ncbi:HAD family acid phosphatase [Endozoicomonas sp. ONNA2]|uniref:HAD family acid phosphatase n=1 Tax=Endozoicomonas sp. ONNA2 TaxID=2828741 RepID=UPI002148C050|nr:HAD family acid phosphatase [Endozoicomonas sp. ONNA2]
MKIRHIIAKKVDKIVLAALLLSPLLNSLLAHSFEQKDLNNEVIIAANWQQHSGEYYAYFYQSFNSASDQLEAILATTPDGKKPAIITDIDDTLISGTPYFTSMVDTNESRSTERTRFWWNHQEAKALPGSVDFLQKANSLGIEIFYISGRFNDVKTMTINKLRQLGYPVSSENHVILQEEQNTTLSKEDKRQQIVKMGYHPIMLFGDQLDDLGEVDKGLYPERKKWVSQHQDKLGTQWFILPNTVYGFWEEAISKDYRTLSPEEKHRARLQQVNDTELPVPISDSYRQHIIMADLWLRKSAQFDATALQTYNLASKAIESPENRYANNRAIIVDIDGTLVDYSLNHLIPPLCKTFPDPEEKMQNHEKQLQAASIPGAREFLNKAAALGYEIFYLTAREHSSGRSGHSGDVENFTLKQLVYHGFPKVTQSNLLNRSKYCPVNKKSCDKQHQRKAIMSGKINGKKYLITTDRTS